MKGYVAHAVHDYFCELTCTPDIGSLVRCDQDAWLSPHRRYEEVPHIDGKRFPLLFLPSQTEHLIFLYQTLTSKAEVLCYPCISLFFNNTVLPSI